MPIIAIVGGPHTGKYMLAQYLLERWQRQSIPVQLIRNSMIVFFEKNFREYPRATRIDKFFIDQKQIMQKQYDIEMALNKDQFNILPLALVSNYCTALIDEFDGDRALMEQKLPGLYKKVVECTKLYDYVVFVDFSLDPSDSFANNKHACIRAKLIGQEILRFLEENKVKFWESHMISGKERSQKIAYSIEKTLNIPRATEKKLEEIPISKFVPCETSTQKEKDKYIQEVWAGIDLSGKGQNIRERKRKR